MNRFQVGLYRNYLPVLHGKSSLIFNILLAGFGTFGKQEIENKYNEAIEEIAEDLESQHVKEVMGISEFGRKAKKFDITEQIAKARELGTKRKQDDSDQLTESTGIDNKAEDESSEEDDEDIIGPLPPKDLNVKTKTPKEKKNEDDDSDSYDDLSDSDDDDSNENLVKRYSQK